MAMESSRFLHPLRPPHQQQYQHPPLPTQQSQHQHFQHMAVMMTQNPNLQGQAPMASSSSHTPFALRPPSGNLLTPLSHGLSSSQGIYTVESLEKGYWLHPSSMAAPAQQAHSMAMAPAENSLLIHNPAPSIPPQQSGFVARSPAFINAFPLQQRLPVFQARQEASAASPFTVSRPVFGWTGQHTLAGIQVIPQGNQWIRFGKQQKHNKAISSSSASKTRMFPAGKDKMKDKGAGWCFVCKIDCNTSDILKRHLAGKKHKRRLQLGASCPEKKPDVESKTETETQPASKSETKNIVEKEAVNEFEQESIVQKAPLNKEALNEVKEESNIQKEPVDKGVNEVKQENIIQKELVDDEAVDGVKQKNVLGKEFVNDFKQENVIKQDPMNEVKQDLQDSTIVEDEAATSSVGAVVIDTVEGKQQKRKYEENADQALKKRRQIEMPSDDANGKKNVKKPVFEKCEICDIYCTSKAILETHFVGKKHVARLKKLKLIEDNQDEKIAVSKPADK